MNGGVYFASINESWGWGGFWGRVQGATDERLDLGDMECGVNAAKGGRKLEMDCGGADNSSNWKGADQAGESLRDLVLRVRSLVESRRSLVESRMSLAITWCLGFHPS